MSGRATTDRLETGGSTSECSSGRQVCSWCALRSLRALVGAILVLEVAYSLMASDPQQLQPIHLSVSVSPGFTFSKA